MAMGSKIIGLVAQLPADAKFLHLSISSLKACYSSSLGRASLKPFHLSISHSTAIR